MRVPSLRRRLAPAVVAALATSGVAAAQPLPHDAAPQLRAPGPVPGDTVLATPFARYDAGPLHRFFLGDGHRELWSVPVPAPVLDLATRAGGLTPTGPGGGNQTRSLRFDGADGLKYQFRSIDKDAARALDPELRNTLAADVVQDQIAALFPLGAMVVTALLDAAGVLNPDPLLVVMPDDPRLGVYRQDFAGTLGWIEVRPDEGGEDTPGFAGSSRVVGTERFLERLEEEPGNRVDAEGYLRARLLDFLVGDRDRHPDQWRWAGFATPDSGLVFEPVPRDRDWALARVDGLMAHLTWIRWPQYVGFSHDYPSAFRASWSGRALDRRLLPELEWSAWEAAARDLQERLTDRVLEDAVSRLPPSHLERVGPELRAALRNRRDDLMRMAREFYELLAAEVDVHATDAEELVRAERLGGGRLRVRVHEVVAGEPRPEPRFDRTFLPGETREVRVDARGGDDHLVVEAAAGGGPDVPGGAGPLLRLVGGGGDDTFEDRTDGHGVRFYDHRGRNAFHPGPRTAVDRRSWTEPVAPADDPHGAGYRSWGARWIPLPALSYDPDLGAFVGAGVQRTTYGFRHHPWKSRLTASAGLSLGVGRPRFEASWTSPFLLPGVRAHIEGLASGAESTRFHGFGNETASGSDPDRFDALHSELRLRPFLSWSPTASLELRAGPSLTLLRPEANPGTLVEELSPYGYGDFEQLALVGRIALDHRDDPTTPRHGAHVEVEGRWAPEALDVRYAWGGLAGHATAYLTGDELPLQPSLALRAGGEARWGAYPWFEAARLGGTASVRGFRTGRFAGDAALWGNAEVRFRLADVVFVLPGDLGALALADAGRVFVDGEDSDRWHSAVGGGVWMSWIDAYTASVSVARSTEETTLYFSLGFAY